MWYHVSYSLHSNTLIWRFPAQSSVMFVARKSKSEQEHRDEDTSDSYWILKHSINWVNQITSVCFLACLCKL